MRTLKSIFLPFIILSFLLSCHKTIEGNGEVIEKKYEINNFNELNLSGGFKVILMQGQTPSLQLKMDKNLVENTHLDFSGKSLKIAEKKAVVKTTAYEVLLTVPTLKKVRLGDHIDLVSNGVIYANDLTITAHDASKINLSLKVKNLELTADEDSETILYGETHTFDVEAGEKAEINAFDFEAKKIDMDVSGTAELKVFVTKSLSGTVVENATVEYREGNFTRDFRAKDQGEVIAIKNDPSKPKSE